jgi:hypothetical protein
MPVMMIIEERRNLRTGLRACVRVGSLPICAALLTACGGIGNGSAGDPIGGAGKRRLIPSAARPLRRQ